MNCKCEYHKSYSDYLICSKKMKDEKIIKHEIRYGKSEGFFNIAGSETD